MAVSIWWRGRLQAASLNKSDSVVRLKGVLESVHMLNFSEKPSTRPWTCEISLTGCRPALNNKQTISLVLPESDSVARRNMIPVTDAGLTIGKSAESTVVNHYIAST